MTCFMNISNKSLPSRACSEFPDSALLVVEKCSFTLSKLRFFNSSRLDSGNSEQALSRHIPNQRSGVVAVLFLVVVAFVFGAISLSMNVGQLVERRIQADHAGDSSAMAFASKSAQGLNFISANNLAIAGASHMAGAIHLTADWFTLISVLWNSDAPCYFQQPFSSSDVQDKYQLAYKILRPISMLYFKAANGLTKLNKVIYKTFPYLGMLDAVTTGGANLPGSVFIPFGAPSEKNNAVIAHNTKDKTSFANRLQNSIKNLIKTMTPSYSGLKKINSDETFCLAYRAGKEGIKGAGGNDYHDLARWNDFGGAPQPFDLLEKALGIPMSLPSKLRLEVGVPLPYPFPDLTFTIDPLSWLGLRVGFSGCGIGEEGAEIGGNDGGFKNAVLGGVILEVLRNSLSGKSFKMTAGEQMIEIPFYKSSKENLASELNNKFQETCNPSRPNEARTNRKGFWKTWKDDLLGVQLDTTPSYEEGVCLIPGTGTKAYRKPIDPGVTKDNALWQMGTPDDRNEQESSSTFFLKNYHNSSNLVCFGTYLFRWEAFSGLSYDPSQLKNVTKDTKPEPIPSAESHPHVPVGDAQSYICPGFEANAQRGGAPIWYPNKTVSDPNPPVIRLNRSTETFTTQIVNRLIDPKNPMKAGASFDELNGMVPNGKAAIRPDALKLINKFLRCIQDSSNCDYRDSQGGYYVTQAVDAEGNRTGPEHKFYPNLNKFNWLCPMSSEDLTAEVVLNHLLKFNTIDQRTWSGNYKLIQEWHNQRVTEFVAQMSCSQFQEFAKHPRKAPPRQTTGGSGGSQGSNDYCSDDSDYCWQQALQKKVGVSELQKGELSFFIPENPDGDSAPPANAPKLAETPLEQSLHYAVFSMVPVRTDKAGSIVGRNDGSSLAHCPENMDVEVKLENGNSARVCDIRPVIGMLGRSFTNETGVVDRNSDDKFGVDGDQAGDFNLAEGGGFRGLDGLMFGQAGFAGISQAKVRFLDAAPGAPSIPANPKTRAKAYQMFWPSWYPAMEPSRVMSRILPQKVSSLVED